MKTLKRVALGVALAIVALFRVAPAANATTVTDDISGSIGGYAFSGDIILDVVGGQAISGSGTINFLGLTNAPLVLDTSGTYEANDGTVYAGADTNYPFDAIGMLFLVGTNTVQPGFPVLDLAAGTDETAFTGIVNGTEYYNITGTATITPTPLPSTWLMLLAGLVGFGFFSYRGIKNRPVALAGVS